MPFEAVAAAIAVPDWNVGCPLVLNVLDIAIDPLNVRLPPTVPDSVGLAITPEAMDIPYMLPVVEDVNPTIESVEIVAFVIVGEFIVGLVSVLFVSVCESVVPTIVPVGAALDHDDVPVPVDTSRLVPDGVLEPVPILVSTAISASFWLS